VRKLEIFCAFLIFTGFMASSIFSQENSARQKKPGPIRVLFIGNSLTSYHQMPKVLANLAKSSKEFPQLYTYMYAPGGYTLEHNFNEGNALKIIRELKWDYVVLQEVSHLTITDKEKFVEYSRKFDNEIKKTGAKTLFYMTWAYRDDPNMFGPVAQAYDGIAQELDAVVSPAGLAWQAVLKQDPNIVLYEDDKVHQSPAGTYLTACVFYITLTGRNPEGLANGGLQMLKKEDCLTLQQIAWRTITQSKNKERYMTKEAFEYYQGNYLKQQEKNERSEDKEDEQ